MQLFANNASSQLLVGITNIGLSLQVRAGEGAKFPSPTGGDYFLVTLSKVVGGIETYVEIVRVTARIGDVFTIVRAQENTTALAFAEDDFVQLRMTAASAAAAETHINSVANPHAVTKAQVGLSNADNTSDADKPVSTAQAAALDLKANLASPTFTGTVGGITAAMVGLGNVDNTSDANKPVSTAQQTALNLKANLASPTFTGTVGGVTKAMVGLGNVDNTSDASKPVSTATQTALDLKAPLASPTFTGTVSGITKAMVGLSNVDNTTDLLKPVSTATQTALDLKAPLASPTFTGTVSGITKAMVGLSAVENTALSTWAGTVNITTVGTVATGTWNATVIADGKIASALTGKTYNGLSLTAAATGFTLAGGTTSKTLTVNNTLGLSGTDGSTLNIGTGGTLGSAAFVSLSSPGAIGSTTPSTAAFTSLNVTENVRVGATQSSWGGSYKAIEFGDVGGFWTSNSSGEVAISGNTYHNGTTYIHKVSGIAPTLYTQSQGVHTWFKAPSAAAGASIVFEEILKLDGNGHLVPGSSNNTKNLGAVANQWATVYGTNFSGNAATVTNGVYTTGDQTIAGVKIFSAARTKVSNANSAMYEMEIPGTHARGFYLDTSGNVRLSTTNGAGTVSTQLILIDGSGNFTATANVTAYSDERLKTNWKSFGDDVVNQLAKVKTGIYDRLDMPATQVGVSAQSLQEVMPDAVNTGDNGLLSVAYGNAALAAAVMLARKVVELEARLAKLEA